MHLFVAHPDGGCQLSTLSDHRITPMRVESSKLTCTGYRYIEWNVFVCCVHIHVHVYVHVYVHVCVYVIYVGIMFT